MKYYAGGRAKLSNRAQMLLEISGSVWIWPKLGKKIAIKFDTFGLHRGLHLQHQKVERPVSAQCLYQPLWLFWPPLWWSCESKPDMDSTVLWYLTMQYSEPYYNAKLIHLKNIPYWNIAGCVRNCYRNGNIVWFTWG